MLSESLPRSEPLIVDYIPLVGHIVRETLGRLPSHIGRDELTSAGLVALVQAARSFDSGRGVRFAAYASIRIRGAILDELRDVDWASRSVRRRARQVEQARSDLGASLGRTATEREVAAALGISLDELAANEKDVTRASVLALDGFGEAPAEEVLASPLPGPEDVLEQQERLAYLVDAIAELPDRLRMVIQDYYFASRPMLDIAAELEVSESRVSQMRSEALGLMRDAMNSALDPALVAPAARPAGVAARRRDAYFAAVAARRTVAARLNGPGKLEATA
jgi:RNA polymerase sigma factor for flagellar operon FliA